MGTVVTQGHYSLNVYPNIVRVGYATTIDVYMPTLSGPCGATVTLSSSDPTDSSVATVPQLHLPVTLYIPAYTSWGTVNIVPSGTANAVITASNATNSMSAPITVVAS